MFIKKIFPIILVILLALGLNCSLPEPVDIDPPVVAILYPMNGTSIAGTIKVSIGSSDDDKVKRVWYYLDGELMESSTSPAPQFELDLTPFADDRLHSFVAAAQDKSDNIGYSVPVVVSITEKEDIEPPVVALISPISGQIVADSIKLAATADDNDGIREVAFFINGDSIISIAEYPYEYNYSIPTDQTSLVISIYAKAYDLSDNWSLSEVISVNNSKIDDNIDPVVTILYPTTPGLTSDSVIVQIDAQDNQAVVRVEFYINGILEFIDTAEPWNYTWDLSGYEDNSSHTLFVTAYDAAGNRGSTGINTFTINIDQTPPVITLLYPLSEVITDIVDVVADVFDGIGIDHVEFYVDGVLEAIDTNSPWGWTWDTTIRWADGEEHTLYIKAIDTAGNIGSAGPFTYTIN